MLQVNIPRLAISQVVQVDVSNTSSLSKRGNESQKGAEIWKSRDFLLYTGGESANSDFASGSPLTLYPSPSPSQKQATVRRCQFSCIKYQQYRGSCIKYKQLQVVVDRNRDRDKVVTVCFKLLEAAAGPRRHLRRSCQ